MHFGQWVRGRRRDLDKSQLDCARVLGITVQAWSQMERTTVRPEYDTAVSVAEALGVDQKEVLEAAGYIVNIPNVKQGVLDYIEKKRQEVPAEKLTAYDEGLRKAVDMMNSLILA